MCDAGRRSGDNAHVCGCVQAVRLLQQPLTAHAHVWVKTVRMWCA